MKQILLFALLLCAQITYAQLIPPCPSNTTPPSDLCEQACVYCNFNGLQSSTAGYTSQTPDGFCDTTYNDQWLGFIAGSTSATYTAIPSDCSNGNGLQIALYDSCDGLPLDCNGGTNGGGTIPVSISVNNMVPGNNYFLMIGGYEGDQCSFTIVVSPPSSPDPPIPDAPDSLVGPAQVCPYSIVDYCVPPIPGAGAYTWVAPSDALINGMPPPVTILGNGVGNCVTIDFGVNSGVICVNGANSCFTGPPLCRPILVSPMGAPVGATLHPDTVICEQNLPYVTPWGLTVNASGMYSTSYQTGPPCDSIERQLVTVRSNPPTVLPPLVLCTGENLVICGDTISPSGPGTLTCTDIYGCDSVVTFNALISPVLDAQINNGADTIFASSFPVSLSFPVGPGAPTWFFNGTQVGTSTVYMASASGEYVLRLEYSVGPGSCSVYDTVQIVNLVQGSEPLSQAHFSVQPTIGQGQYFLKTESGTMQQLRLFDLHGRLVFEEKIQNAKAFTLDVPEIPAGAYVLTVLVNGVWEKVRLVKM